MGFTLLETVVASSLLAAVALGTIAAHPRPPQRRVAALGLQDAFAETRALAVGNAAAADGAATGATLVVEPVAGGTGTRVTVYRSRPIAGAAPLERDRGFAALTFPVRLTLAGSGAAGATTFGVFVSSAGYASILPGFAYDAAHPAAVAADPGCMNGGTIAIADESGADSYPLACRTRLFSADAETASPAPAATGRT